MEWFEIPLSQDNYDIVPDWQYYWDLHWADVEDWLDDCRFFFGANYPYWIDAQLGHC